MFYKAAKEITVFAGFRVRLTQSPEVSEELNVSFDAYLADWKLFRYNHEPGLRELLKSLDLDTDPSSGMTPNTKSLRVTGINLRLLKNPGVPLNDLRKWCRTSIVQIQHFYDQAHPETSAARVAGRSESSKTQ